MYVRFRACLQSVTDIPVQITISFLNHLYERHDSMLNDLVDAAICKQKTRFGVCLEAEDFDEIYSTCGQLLLNLVMHISGV